MEGRKMPPLTRLVWSFFFYGFGHPRDLHSFPTRRSSDLEHEARDARRVILERAQDGIADLAATAVPARALRSEEHTSELQSRFDLVCRLLLEKKKKITTAAGISEHDISPRT